MRSAQTLKTLKMMLSLLGRGHKDSTDIYTLDQFVSVFRGTANRLPRPGTCSFQPPICSSTNSSAWPLYFLV
jgi:hypothetical protein